MQSAEGCCKICWIILLTQSGRFSIHLCSAWFNLFLNAELTKSPNMMYLIYGNLSKEKFIGRKLWKFFYCTFFNLIALLIVAFLFQSTTVPLHISIQPKGFLATVAENKLQRLQPGGFLLKGVIANIFVIFLSIFSKMKQPRYSSPFIYMFVFYD